MESGFSGVCILAPLPRASVLHLRAFRWLQYLSSSETIGSAGGDNWNSGVEVLLSCCLSGCWFLTRLAFTRLPVPPVSTRLRERSASCFLSEDRRRRQGRCPR